MEKRYINRYRSFVKSLDALKELKSRDINDSFVVSGGVQKFDLAFDICWKVMKDIITNYFGLTDFATGSPRDTLRAAHSVGLIHDDVWMVMLRDRNELTHDYDGELASQAIVRIRDIYIPVLEQFCDTASEYMKKMQEEGD